MLGTFSLKNHIHFAHRDYQCARSQGLDNIVHNIQTNEFFEDYFDFFFNFGKF